MIAHGTLSVSASLRAVPWQSEARDHAFIAARPFLDFNYSSEIPF
jgi:hypothetical protein